MKQVPLALGFDPERSFDTFLPGANSAAVDHLRHLAPGAPPTYVWGVAGSGKTHLLSALAAAWQAKGARVGWFGPASAAPWPFDEGWTLIVLDDCDAFDAAQQHAAFTLFVQAGIAGIALVSAGGVPPVDLAVREDLRSRLGWGHVFALQPLAESDVRAVLRREADRRGIFLSDEIMAYLLTRFARDPKHLMALLERLDAFALASQRVVTIPLLKRMLEEEGG